MRTLPIVEPTSEQLPIVADSFPGFRLIRGAAGSGKTTTALLRLKLLCEARLARQARMNLAGPVRILVLTFNRTLRGYIDELTAAQITPSSSLEITVNTFSQWAWQLLQPARVLDNAEQSARIRHLLLSTRTVSSNVGYFVDEVNYLLGRFHPSQRDTYLDVERTGRGRAPAVNRQLRSKILADVIGPYENQKLNERVVDWNDIALAAATIDSRKYDVVVADETQDFSANQLRSILAHLDTDHVTTFIMDATQRIYPQGFQWREIGIDMRPNMVFTLRSNHRNTAEIARLASSLIRDLPVEENGVAPDPETCERSGPIPRVIAGIYSTQLKYMIDYIRPFHDQGDTVGVLQPRAGRWFDHARRELSRQSISYCELTQNREWPTGPEQIALSTIHSAKGLEFDHVLLPGLNREVTPHGEEDGDGQLDSLRRLVAMGIGRARKTVMLGYKPGEQSTLIEFLDPTIYDLVEV